MVGIPDQKNAPGNGRPIGGIVLCGGRSVRMGRAKEWLALGGETLLQRMVRIVGEVVGPVVVAGRNGQELPLLPESVRVVHDGVEDCGPLAGLLSGMEALADSCAAVFVASCDHALLRPAFVRRLLERMGAGSGAVPYHGGMKYPLLAAYRVTTLPLLRSRLSQRLLRAHEFAEACGAILIDANELRDVDGELDSLRNINDIEEYRRVADLESHA